MPNFVKALLREGAARALSLGGVTRPSRRGRRRLSIATFHRVLPPAERAAYPFPGLVVTPQELDALLGYFTGHFDCGALCTQHARFAGDGACERPLLALTFDDGQHDNYRHARPLLAKHGVKASFFAPVVAVERQELLWHDRMGFATLALLATQRGRERLRRVLGAAGLPEDSPHGGPGLLVQRSKALPADARLRLVDALADATESIAAPPFARLMTFSELAELARDGHEVGSHSMTHAMMDECDDRALSYELVESRRALQDRLGHPVESFCYPNGNCDARSAAAAAAAGYRRAVTTQWGSNAAGADAFRLRRCDMDAEHLFDAKGRFLPELLAFRMSGLYPGLG